MANIPPYIFIYSTFFIQSSIDAYLCCFHVLPIANSAAVYFGVHSFFRIMVLLGVYPEENKPHLLYPFIC